MIVPDMSNVLVHVPMRAMNMLVNGYLTQSVGRMDTSGSYIIGSYDASGVFKSGLNGLYAYDESLNEYEKTKNYAIDLSDLSGTLRRIDQVNQDRTQAYATPIFTKSRMAMNKVKVY
jgi:hypothetical protein